MDNAQHDSAASATSAGGRVDPSSPGDKGPAPGQEGPAGAICFSPLVRLTKREAFDACQALADADRFLVRAGRRAEADALGDLFELFEERLSAGGP
jgi:hypothetical protein